MQGSTPWPIIILSLDGDDERRAPLLGSITALGLPFEVFLGIDGRKGLATRWQAEIDRNTARQRLGRKMTDGEFACALSHRAIYQRILNEGWDGAVVLEDDAIIGPNFDAFMTHGIFEKAELLLLDHSHARVWRGSKEVLPGVQMFQLSMSPSLATAYSISRIAAEILIDSNTPVRYLADWPCDVTGVGAAVLVPQIIGHTDQKLGVSHLRQERQHTVVTHQKSGLQRLARLLTSDFWKRWFIKRLSRRVS